MNQKEFFGYIVPRLEPYLKEQGYIFKSSKNGFVKLYADGWMRVYFEFYRFAGTNNFLAGFDLRNNTVEEIFVKYVDINPSGHKSSTTFGFTLAKLSNEKDTYFNYDNTDELDFLLNEKVIPFLVNKVPAFSEHYRNLENIYFLFTNDQEENNKYIHSSYSNYITALILGWLLYPDNFDALIAKCQELFLRIKKKWPEHYDIELYERDFKNIVTDLSMSNNNPLLTGTHGSINTK